MGSGPEWEGLTLENLAEGKLEEQFQDALAEALEVIEDVDEQKYEVGKDKVVAVKIQMEAVLEYDLETRSVVVGGRVTGTKRPKRRAIYRAGSRQGGTVLVEKAHQGELLSLARTEEGESQ